MSTDQIISWTRAVLLIVLLGYFASDLWLGLKHDESADGFGQLHQGIGQDPGVRIAIANRSLKEPAAAPSLLHDSIELAILQNVVVTTPDDPTNPDRRMQLAGGTRLLLLPDANDGLVLSSRDWGAGGRELHWPVSRVRVEPQATNPAPPTGTAAALRDPGAFEAADRDGVFALQGRSYRGSAEIVWATPKQLLLVNALPMEAYVEGVVAVEMSSAYPIEALKAQAIVSRSFAFARAYAARRSRHIYDLVDGDDDQEYHGTGNGTEVVSRAVNETRGTITFTDMAQGSCPFAPLFCASDGGYTDDVEAVFPDQRDIYGHPLAGSAIMPSRPDPFCQLAAEHLGCTATHWFSSDIVKPGEIRAALQRLGKLTNDPRLAQVGFTKDLRVGRRNPLSNRVETVVIHHTMGDPIEIPAQTFRSMIGGNRIRSTLWTLDSPKRVDAPDGRSTAYRIQCYGFGHGVGLSEISAWEMAQQGWLAPGILGFFYPKVVLRAIW
jgi:peptidoglycan hydrolase-like amidase